MSPNAPTPAARSALPYWALASGSAIALVAGAWPGALCLAVAALLLLLLAPLRSDRQGRTPQDNGAAPQRVGQYELGEKLGEGGMGVVYKARRYRRDPAQLERPVAIKLLPRHHASQENIQRFEREVQLTSRLSHPNTIAVIDSGHTGEGLPYYAMEYVQGLDLQTLVERHGPLQPARVAQLLAQLASALSEVHATGLVHRDVKPANVMLCERDGAQDVVKMLDFGLTLALADRGSSELGQIAGTPLYLPPEAITAPERIDARSDLYSLGALGYFLLTGVPPFEGRNLAELCGHHVHSAPQAPSDRLGLALPARLEALILSCLAKSPGDRPQSAAELEAALLPLTAGWTAPRPLESSREAECRRRSLSQPESSGVELCFLPTMIAA